ncbi:MAG: hypothetical protein ACLQFR_14705 [Streptosporangiaceae bacterium]
MAELLGLYSASNSAMIKVAITDAAASRLDMNARGGGWSQARPGQAGLS